MVPPCFHPGKTESTVVVFSGWRTFLSGLQTTQKQPISLPLLFLFHRSISLGRRRIRMDKQRGKRRGRGGRFVWMVMTLNSRVHSWSPSSGCSPLCFNNLNYVIMSAHPRDRLSLFCSKSLVKEEISTASAPPQRWSSVSNLSLARRAKI